MATDKTLDSFRSPMRKLVRFFRDSRDGWKEKCRQARDRSRRLGNQVRAVEKSRAHWKQRFREQRKQARELQRELEQIKKLGC
jgi:hypothetical protein